MKKITLIITAFGLLAWHSHAEAQSNYFSLQTGYAMGIAQQTNWNETYNEESGQRTFENQYYSTGEGIQVKLIYGHMFSDAFGVEMSIAQLFGQEQERIFEMPDYKATSKERTNLTIINPSVVYSFSNNKLSPYAKFGFCGSIGTNKSSHTNDWTWTEELSEEYTTTSKLNLGITSAIGASLKLNDKVSLVGEATFMSSTFNPKKQTLTKSTIGNEDQLKDMTTRDKESVFVDEVTEDYDQEPNEDQPEEYPNLKVPMSNLAFTFGIKYSF